MIKRTPQEWADITGCYVVRDRDSRFFDLYPNKPEINTKYGWWDDEGGNADNLPYGAVDVDLENHDWTHLYEPCVRNTCENKDENARITQEPSTNPASLCPHQSEVHTHREYKVVCYTNENSLSETVTSMMSEGWKPQGSIAMVYLGEIYCPPIMYAQAMVRGV